MESSGYPFLLKELTIWDVYKTGVLNCDRYIGRLFFVLPLFQIENFHNSFYIQYVLGLPGWQLALYDGDVIAGYILSKPEDVKSSTENRQLLHISALAIDIRYRGL